MTEQGPTPHKIRIQCPEQSPHRRNPRRRGDFSCPRNGIRRPSAVVPVRHDAAPRPRRTRHGGPHPASRSGPAMLPVPHGPSVSRSGPRNRPTGFHVHFFSTSNPILIRRRDLGMAHVLSSPSGPRNGAHAAYAGHSLPHVPFRLFRNVKR